MILTGVPVPAFRLDRLVQEDRLSKPHEWRGSRLAVVRRTRPDIISTGFIILRGEAEKGIWKVYPLGPLNHPDWSDAAQYNSMAEFLDDGWVIA